MNILAVFILGFAWAAAQSGCPPPSEEEEAYHDVISALDAFSINLYQEVRLNAPGNLVLSPLSVDVVLALTWLGAKGRSAQQLGDALHLPLSRQRVADGFRHLMATLPTADNQSDDDDALLRLANRLYVQSGFHIKEDFLHSAVEDFQSGVEALNFGDSENARTIINQWVANNTDNRILDLIPEGMLSSDTRLILVNAILFRAMWLHHFRESDTRNETFYLTGSEKVNVSMMSGSFQLGYSELPDFNATALRLPYNSNDFESDMVILLPNSVTGLEALEKNLGQLVISSIPFQSRQVSVRLPKFTIETTSPLTQILTQMGVRDIFGPEADLTGISDIPLYVNDVIQKAYIRVNENGTEAAAATVVSIVRLTAAVNIIPPIEFTADHPFLFFLQINGNNIFIGRVTNPNE